MFRRAGQERRAGRGRRSPRSWRCPAGRGKARRRAARSGGKPSPSRPGSRRPGSAVYIADRRRRSWDRSHQTEKPFPSRAATCGNPRGGWGESAATGRSRAPMDLTDSGVPAPPALTATPRNPSGGRTEPAPSQGSSFVRCGRGSAHLRHVSTKGAAATLFLWGRRGFGRTREGAGRQDVSPL